MDNARKKRANPNPNKDNTNPRDVISRRRIPCTSTAKNRPTPSFSLISAILFLCPLSTCNKGIRTRWYLATVQKIDFLGMTEPNDTKVKTLRRITGAQAYPGFKAAIDSLLSSQEEQK